MLMDPTIAAKVATGGPGHVLAFSRTLLHLCGGRVPTGGASCSRVLTNPFLAQSTLVPSLSAFPPLVFECSSSICPILVYGVQPLQRHNVWMLWKQQNFIFNSHLESPAWRPLPLWMPLTWMEEELLFTRPQNKRQELVFTRPQNKRHERHCTCSCLTSLPTTVFLVALLLLLLPRHPGQILPVAMPNHLKKQKKKRATQR